MADIFINGTFKDISPDETVAYASQVKDIDLNSTQAEINASVQNTLNSFHPYDGNVYICLIIEDEEESTHKLLLMRPYNYASNPPYQEGFVVGIAIYGGGRWLIVALDEMMGPWGPAQASGVTLKPNLKDALEDMDGKSNFTTQCTAYNVNAQSTGTGIAYCYNYDKTFHDAGVGPTKWWIPSEGELLLIFANIEAINYAMSLVEGTPIEYPLYSSTEADNNTVWAVANGYITGIDKNAVSVYQATRPVTSLTALTNIDYY